MCPCGTVMRALSALASNATVLDPCFGIIVCDHVEILVC